MSPPRPLPLRTLRAIASFEAIKGAGALLLLWVVLTLSQLDLHAWALSHIENAGLDPESHYPALVLHYAQALPQANLHAVVWLALGYAGLRFIEAMGLWHNRDWAKYLGAASGGIYIPFEIEHLVHQPNALSVAILGLNVFIVAYLIIHLWRGHRT